MAQYNKARLARQGGKPRSLKIELVILILTLALLAVAAPPKWTSAVVTGWLLLAAPPHLAQWCASQVSFEQDYRTASVDRWIIWQNKGRMIWLWAEAC